MPQFTLQNTAVEIDTAVQKVHNADTAPTAGSKDMVTSEGVKTYVDDKFTGAFTGTFDAHGGTVVTVVNGVITGVS
jgi:hypothetical protein